MNKKIDKKLISTHKSRIFFLVLISVFSILVAVSLIILINNLSDNTQENNQTNLNKNIVAQVKPELGISENVKSQLHEVSKFLDKFPENYEFFDAKKVLTIRNNFNQSKIFLNAGEFDKYEEQISQIKTLIESYNENTNNHFLLTSNNIRNALINKDTLKAKKELDSLYKVIGFNKDKKLFFDMVHSFDKAETIYRSAMNASKNQDYDLQLNLLGELKKIPNVYNDIEEEFSNALILKNKVEVEKYLKKFDKYFVEQNLQSMKETYAKIANLNVDKIISQDLKNKIKNIEIRNKLTSIKGSLTNYLNNYEWDKIIDVCEKNKKILTIKNSTAEEILQIHKIATLGKELIFYNNHPEILVKKSKRIRGQSLIEDVKNSNFNNKFISKELKKLATNLKNYNTPVGLTIISDGFTEVSVRGSQYLGKFKKIEVFLKPGDYFIIGVRNGYQDALKKVSLNPNSVNFNIVIKADEKL